MDSSSTSSASSGLSSLSSPFREPTPEWDSMAAHEILAPTKWDEEDHDSSVWSEDDKSLTDGEDDFRFLVDGEGGGERTTSLGTTSSDEEEEEAISVPHNLSFTSSTDGFETWWSTWKTRAFRRALGPLLKQLDAEYDIHAEQQKDDPEPVHDDGSPFRFLPPAPVVLFCKNSPPLKKGYDLSSLLTFDHESIEPGASKASEGSGPSATHGQLQHLKALLSSSIETLVENTEEVKSILEDIQPHLPVTLQVKLWRLTLVAYGSRVKLARRENRLTPHFR
ncbi:hypothetical protein QYE76_068162 [Lolium multiflorum]|uniref:Uncharacterized protein n=1 Tax=Lolium multiflorum TaxID=4521 RepID=A0AAD8WDP3_LOLMU|nr:hypothetical protein QYE76_068162 [Lolium multiflorum]